MRLRSLFRRNTVETEMDEELRAHVERQTEKYIRSGMPHDEAARQATKVDPMVALRYE